MIIINLGDILRDLNRYSWNEWVYIESIGAIDINTKCIVINPDHAELGSDNFTPALVQSQNMIEFLSIQDLICVKENILQKQPMASILDICTAAIFYFENDAFSLQFEV